MKQFLSVFTLLLFITVALRGQTCTPDGSQIPPGELVFPFPYDAMTMTGGIPDSACINQPFEFVFQIRVPANQIVGGNVFAIDSVVIRKADGSPPVSGLVDGMSYECNMPDCAYRPPMDSLACVRLFGTVSNTVQPGGYPLLINYQVYGAGIPVPIELSWPDPTNPEGYTLWVFEEGDSRCVVGTEDLEQLGYAVELSPNPSTGKIILDIDSPESGDISLNVVDPYGKVVEQQQLELFSDDNRIPLDLSGLAKGKCISFT